MDPEGCEGGWPYRGLGMKGGWPCCSGEMLGMKMFLAPDGFENKKGLGYPSPGNQKLERG